MEAHSHDSPDLIDRSLGGQHHLAFVLVDISGYTMFMVSTRTSVLHAQEIIFQLLESVIAGADHPLVLNKLEGDAILLYADLSSGKNDVSRDVLKQVNSFYAAFRRKVSELTRDRASCSCTACSNIGSLRLKAILHAGSAVVREVRGFTEIGGEDVIVVHRLLKNSVKMDEYLMTDPYHDQVAFASSDSGKRSVEVDVVLGDILVWAYPAPSR